MIVFTNKSVFDSGCEMFVNTINCFGKMGAGIALEFSLRYPKMFSQYKEDCKNRLIEVGHTYLYVDKGQKILNFPTKGLEPKNPSQISFIVSGLDFFIEHYKEYDVNSVAFPPLGCTNGQLDFENNVKPIMLSKLSEVDLDISICLNNFPLYGLEKEMTSILKKMDIEELKILFNNNDDFLKFKNRLANVNRFSQIASHQYLPSEEVYRKIWNNIYERIK